MYAWPVFGSGQLSPGSIRMLHIARGVIANTAVSRVVFSLTHLNWPSGAVI